MDVKYSGFKKIFKTVLNVDDEYTPTIGTRLANNVDSMDYSSLESMPYLKNRVLAFMGQAKAELGMPKSKRLAYFDENRWANDMTNQIYQINRVYNDDVFVHVLVREADELHQDYYGVIANHI